MFLVSYCSHWSHVWSWEWAVLTGDAPTTSEWSTILLPKVQLILEVYSIYKHMYFKGNIWAFFFYWTVGVCCGHFGENLSSYKGIALYIHYKMFHLIMSKTATIWLLICLFYTNINSRWLQKTMSICIYNTYDTNVIKKIWFEPHISTRTWLQFNSAICHHKSSSSLVQ